MRSFLDDSKCLGVWKDMPRIWNCRDKEAQVWTVSEDVVGNAEDSVDVTPRGRQFVYQFNTTEQKCLGLSGARQLDLVRCDEKDAKQFWELETLDLNYTQPTHSPHWLSVHN